LGSLLHLFRRGEVPPLQGQGGLTAGDDKVVVIRPKPRTVLGQLYPKPRPWHAPAWTEADRLEFIEKSKNTTWRDIAYKRLGDPPIGTCAPTYVCSPEAEDNDEELLSDGTVCPPALYLTPRWIAARDRILARAHARKTEVCR
jgi:hypothetical protein